MIKEEELAYIAGLLDADGWMSLHDNGYVVTFTCGIVNANKPVLDWICSHFGGTVRAHSRPKSREGKNWTQIWSYLPQADAAKPFLLAIRPFLRIKIRQCDIVLEFLDTRARSGPANHRTPPAIVARRNELLVEIRKLNQVGIQPKLHFKEPRQAKSEDKSRDWGWGHKRKAKPSDNPPTIM
jgi:hypothetical protein